MIGIGLPFIQLYLSLSMSYKKIGRFIEHVTLSHEDATIVTSFVSTLTVRYPL